MRERSVAERCGVARLVSISSRFDLRPSTFDQATISGQDANSRQGAEASLSTDD